MMDGTGYTEYDSNGLRKLQPPGPISQLSTASGIAISGANIFNALAAGNPDAVENEWVTLDECISHPTPTKEYHYHMWSPCSDHDVCNGAFIDGNYVYLSTTTFPYILGCFGPAVT